MSAQVKGGIAGEITVMKPLHQTFLLRFNSALHLLSIITNLLIFPVQAFFNPAR